MKHDFAEGKYTVICGQALRALRYGKIWRELTGDNLVYWMLVEVDKLKGQNAELLEALRETLDEGIGWFEESGGWDSEQLDWVIRARAAIAKATGETK